METPFLNFFVRGGASDSITEAEFAQTEAIAFRVFQLAHSKVLRSRSLESSKNQFQVNLKFLDSTVGRELQANACRVEPRSTIQYVFADTRCLQGEATARRQRLRATPLVAWLQATLPLGAVAESRISTLTLRPRFLASAMIRRRLCYRLDAIFPRKITIDRRSERDNFA
jgi:hypothetical protein